MTKQEVKDELKQTEGDPYIKSYIKGKQLAMARSRMIQDVSKADVVITSPNHYVVALKYEMGADSVPKVITKGVNYIAEKIKTIAREHDIPLHEDVQLARALCQLCEVGDEIPKKLYQAVAQILVYIFQLNESKKKKNII